MWPLLVLAAIGATWYVATKNQAPAQPSPSPAQNPALPNLPNVPAVPAVIPGPAGPIPVPVVPIPPPGVVIPPGTPGSAVPSGSVPNLSDVADAPAPVQVLWSPAVPLPPVVGAPVDIIITIPNAPVAPAPLTGIIYYLGDGNRVAVLLTTGQQMPIAIPSGKVWATRNPNA